VKKARPVPRVALGFELTSLRIPIADIEPLRVVTAAIRKSVKFGQIAASIAEVGLIEPPVVIRKPHVHDRFQLLDGHLRIDILKARGEADVVCLIATEDEAVTYNKRISRLATVQEHRMILNAIQTKRRLLEGICDEVVTLLQDRHVPINTFKELKKLRPMRQISVAETMIALNRFSVSCARSLVASSPQSDLVRSERRTVKGLSDTQLERMEQEAGNLDREFRLIETEYGNDHLDLVLATGYLCRLIDNVRIVHHLARSHPEVLAEFQKIAQLRAAA
jgi:hypothetical protein